MQRRTSGIIGTLLAAGVLAACLSSCRKDDIPDNGPEITFSACSSAQVTKAMSYDPDYILGHWVDSTSTYVPGTGIGIFAFHQKAKSNGYPTNFNDETGEPEFMYNQKLERTSSDGHNYSFIYNPKKYWPNNKNDQLSFFAYAPYDSTTAWTEDLRIKSNHDGTVIRRTFVLKDNPEDQTDFLWTDPVLNMKKPDVNQSIEFRFRHICAKLGVRCVINIDDEDGYVTIDKVTFRARFATSGDMVYRTEADSSRWENLQRPTKAKDYVLYDFNSNYGHRVRTEPTVVGGEDHFMFPIPGTQDITVIATISQNVSGRRYSGTLSKTFTAMELKEGKYYNFLLSITIEPVTIGTVGVAEWSVDETTPAIP